MSEWFSDWIAITFSNYRWCRRWVGGRWERHAIDVCGNRPIWLRMSDNPARQWPAYRQPCSTELLAIEDWPLATKEPA